MGSETAVDSAGRLVAAVAMVAKESKAVRMVRGCAVTAVGPAVEMEMEVVAAAGLEVVEGAEEVMAEVEKVEEEVVERMAGAGG